MFLAQLLPSRLSKSHCCNRTKAWAAGPVPLFPLLPSLELLQITLIARNYLWNQTLISIALHLPSATSPLHKGHVHVSIYLNKVTACCWLSAQYLVVQLGVTQPDSVEGGSLVEGILCGS